MYFFLNSQIADAYRNTSSCTNSGYCSPKCRKYLSNSYLMLSFLVLNSYLLYSGVVPCLLSHIQCCRSLSPISHTVLSFLVSHLLSLIQSCRSLSQTPISHTQLSFLVSTSYISYRVRRSLSPTSYLSYIVIVPCILSPIQSFSSLSQPPISHTQLSFLVSNSYLPYRVVVPCSLYLFYLSWEIIAFEIDQTRLFYNVHVRWINMMGFEAKKQNHFTLKTRYNPVTYSIQYCMEALTIHLRINYIVCEIGGLGCRVITTQYIIISCPFDTYVTSIL